MSKSKERKQKELERRYEKHGYFDGRYLRVWFSEKLRKCCCNRFAMAMWLVWDGIVKRRGAG